MSRFWIEYIERGIKCSDSWTARTLIDEIAKKEVEIIGIYWIYANGEVSSINQVKVWIEG